MVTRQQNYLANRISQGTPAMTKNHQWSGDQEVSTAPWEAGAFTPCATVRRVINDPVVCLFLNIDSTERESVERGDVLSLSSHLLPIPRFSLIFAVTDNQACICIVRTWLSANAHHTESISLQPKSNSWNRWVRQCFPASILLELTSVCIFQPSSGYVGLHSIQHLFVLLSCVLHLIHVILRDNEFYLDLTQSIQGFCYSLPDFVACLLPLILQCNFFFTCYVLPLGCDISERNKSIIFTILFPAPNTTLD